MLRNFSEVILLCCLFLGSLFSWPAIAGEEKSVETARDCKVAREFITTLEYLRGQKELELSESEAQKVANRVAEGCTGSAGRFIRAFEVLNRVEAGTRVSLKVGVELSSKTDAHVDTFLEIFRRSFLKTHLDLDLKSALKIARSLSLEYKGDVRVVGKDFEALVKFCLDEKKLGLAIPQCAAMAARVSLKGDKYPKGITKDFTEFYSFLRNEPTLGMNISEAVAIAEEVTCQSSVAAENFRLAYNYALNDKGLRLSARKSLDVARGMAGMTRQQVPDSSQTRLPASAVDSQ